MASSGVCAVWPTTLLTFPTSASLQNQTGVFMVIMSVTIFSLLSMVQPEEGRTKEDELQNGESTYPIAVSPDEI